LLNFFLDLQEKAENSSSSVLKIMGSKNACALEFAWILGRNIKCSVIIIIIINTILTSVYFGFSAAESFGYVMSKLAVINNNGTVTWMPHARLRSRCFMDLSLFPYDTQKCTQAFGSWTYDKTLVNLTLVKKTYSSDKFLYQGGEWQVVDYQSDMFEYSDNIKDYKAAIYTLSLKRVTVFYRYILVYPTVIFAILTLFICWIPHESNQRLMLG